MEAVERMGAVERMDRGKLCPMSGGTHYYHQTSRNGRNEVRYVPKGEVAQLKKDFAVYQLFTKLAEQYAGEVIRQSRYERKKKKRGPKPKA